MLKRKTLTAFLIIAFLSFAWAASGAIFSTVRADEVTVVSDGFERTGDEITGVNLSDSVTGKFKLVIPAGVTSIGNNAFDEIDNLVAAELPDTLTRIGNYAFSKTNITAINIPANVTEIGEHAFNGCHALTSVNFASCTAELSIGMFAFFGCTGLRTINLPANTTVSQFAFDGCTSLLWVYAGDNARFVNNGTPGAVFFPTNTQLKIVFPSQTAYNQALSQADETFKNSHGAAATYVVKVKCYVGDSTEPEVYERLHGNNFNYVKDDGGYWNNLDTAGSALPVQHQSYSATTWYAEKTLTNSVNYDGVNALLNGNASEINLYCHETVLAPAFPAEPVSWVYDSKISYDIKDIEQVLTALGCEQSFTDAQLAAMDFNVVFANEKGDIADTPDSIKGNGVYSVTFTLDSAYGSWAQTVNPSLTVNVNTGGFNVILIIFLVLGVACVAATISTAIVRKKVQDRSRRKQLSQKEVMEKFKAAGGESNLIK